MPQLPKFNDPAIKSCDDPGDPDKKCGVHQEGGHESRALFLRAISLRHSLVRASVSSVYFLGLLAVNPIAFRLASGTARTTGASNPPNNWASIHALLEPTCNRSRLILFNQPG